jgi:hypothetical protein
MRRLAALLLAVAVLGGCDARRDDARVAAQAANGFSTALTNKDAAIACSLLAPDTQHQLEKSAKAPCTEAVLDQELPEPGAVIHTDVFGSEARVVFTADTMFLTNLDGAWKLAAAGCTPRGDLPYDCALEGG